MTSEVQTEVVASGDRPVSPARGLVNSYWVPSRRRLRRPLLLGHDPVVVRLDGGAGEDGAIIFCRSAGLSAGLQSRTR
ncbi:MAG: hypothetical protein ACUVV6_07010 [Thermoplasmatota archaeon]